MAILGIFTQQNGAFHGTIETFLTVLAVRIEPVTASASAAAPDYRVYRGKAEIGAAWSRTTKSNRRFLAVVIDDPSLARAVECRLVQAAEGWRLMWSRA